MTLRIEFAPALMTREIAAYYIDGTLRDIDELRAKGELTPVGGQKRIKFRKTDLDHYIAALEERDLIKERPH
jgi:hypothetical protein